MILFARRLARTVVKGVRTGPDRTVPYETVPYTDSVPGTSCQATIGRPYGTWVADISLQHLASPNSATPELLQLLPPTFSTTTSID
jgi:hypothetical protein